MPALQDNSDHNHPPDERGDHRPADTPSGGLARATSAVTWVGRQLYGQVRKSCLYYWNRRKAFKTYVVDHLPGFIDVDKRGREIHIERHQRSMLADYDPDRGWRVELPDCCVVCGQPTAMPWVDEERMVEDVGRLIKVPLYIAAGSFVVSFFFGGWLLFLAGSLGGFLVAHRLQHSERVELRLRRCKKHIDQNKIPRLRLFPNKLILRVGSKTIRSRFYEVGQKTRGMSRPRKKDPASEKLSALMTPKPRQKKPANDPIPLADVEPGPRPGIEHPDSGHLEKPAPPNPLAPKPRKPADSKSEPGPLLTSPIDPVSNLGSALVADDDDALPVPLAESSYVPSGDLIRPYDSPLLSDDTNPGVVSSNEESATYSFDGEGPATSLELLPRPGKSGFEAGEKLVSDLKVQSAGRMLPPSGIGLGQMFAVWGSGRYVISEGLLLAFYVTLRLVLLCAVLALFVPVYQYVVANVLPGAGPRRVLDYYLVANLAAVALAGMVFHWESVYLPLTLGSLVLFGIQEFLWRRFGNPEMSVLDPDFSIGFGLFCISNLPILVFTVYAFVRSLGHISGRFMMVCEHFALEKEIVSFDRFDYRGASRILGVIVIAIAPLVLVWKLWPIAIQQPWWPREPDVVPQWYAWIIAGTWLVYYFPMGVVSSTLAPGGTRPWVAQAWTWRLKLEYFLSLLTVAVIAAVVGTLIWQFCVVPYSFNWFGVNAKILFAIGMVGLSHYLLLGLFAMLGVAARRHRHQLVFKSELSA